MSYTSRENANCFYEGSYWFLDTKNQEFFQTFFQNIIISFFRLKVIK